MFAADVTIVTTRPIVKYAEGIQRSGLERAGGERIGGRKLIVTTKEGP
jgi:hypothetical protein